MVSNPLSIPTSSPVKATVTIPSSKSINNRALLLASLAKGESQLNNILDCDDTYYMKRALKQLGIQIREENNSLFITGSAGKFSACHTPLYIENAGTASRFLTVALNLGEGKYMLSGNERMHQRPIIDLTKALKTLGCNIKHSNKTEALPLEIEATGTLNGGTISIQAENSSQYVSAIAMCAVYAKNDIQLYLQGNIVSKTYINMTLQVMQDFGVNASWLDSSTLLIPANQCYQAQEYTIEGDASSASYFLALPAIVGGKITVNGFTPYSTQGDWGIVSILEQMGCFVERTQTSISVSKLTDQLQSVAVDMNTMSDVAPTVAVTALFAQGKTTIYNIGNMRLKECDRISALATELTKLGAVCEETDTSLTITPAEKYTPTSFHTYDDHRMAMSLALAATKIGGCTIKDPACVSKTFPSFFDMFLPLVRS